MSRFVFFLVLVAVALGGCDTTVQPPIPSQPKGLAVYSAVQAWDSTQYAVVTRPRAADERSLQHVQDATVKMNGQQLSVVPTDSILFGGVNSLTPPGDRRANYETDSLVVQPGETVRLRVTTEAHEVRGRTRVPGSFTAAVDSMTLRWTPSAGAQLYKVRVRRYDEGNVKWEYVTTTPDTTTTIPRKTGRSSELFKSGLHEVRITAADSNLVAYRERDVRRAGLEGGFGFFGAITRIRGFVRLPDTSTSKRTRSRDVVTLSVPDEGKHRASPPDLRHRSGEGGGYR